MLLSDQDVVQAVMITMVDDCHDQSSTDSRSDSNTKCDFKTVLKPRMSRLKKLLIQADQLRLHTLHQLFLVLTPIQVARCAIAAFELAFSMRALGASSTSPSNPPPPPPPSTSSASSSRSKPNLPTQFAKSKICSEIRLPLSASDDDENDEQPSTSPSSYDDDDGDDNDIDTTDVVLQHWLCWVEVMCQSLNFASLLHHSRRFLYFCSQGFLACESSGIMNIQWIIPTTNTRIRV